MPSDGVGAEIGLVDGLLNRSDGRTAGENRAFVTKLETPVTNGPLVQSQAVELRAQRSTPVTSISSGKEAGTLRSVVEV